jgi:glc operon protein GlcG
MAMGLFLRDDHGWRSRDNVVPLGTIFRRPSKEFEDQVRNGRVAALRLPGATPLQGGIPVTVEGRVIGAMGARGNSPQEDEEIALAGANMTAAAVPEEGR